MKIGIIGTGISGLAAARALHGSNEMHLFESAEYVGGHTRTVMVDDGSTRLPVDTGFIVFNDPNYPNLNRLFNELGVASRESDMSFSVSCERSGVEYNGAGPSALFAQRRNLVNPVHWRMLADILRFHKQAPRCLAEGLDDVTTVEEFVREQGYGEAFATRYLLPLGASLWSASGARFSRFPVRFVIEFLHNHRMLQVSDRPVWKTVVGGSSAYVAPLVEPFKDRIRLNQPVTAVRRCGRGVEVHGRHGVEHFDEVVLACHADQALRLVQDPDPVESELLRYFPYSENETVLHTDESMLPRIRSVWASWNYRIPAADADKVSVTYNMNMLQGLTSERTYCVSLNPGNRIDPDRVIRRFTYHHPVFNPGRRSAQDRHHELVRRRGLSYCGAYWGYGFHEDGLSSALRVAASYDLDMAA